MWPNMSEALAPGVLIAGRYRLEELLGTGGMGAVWSASHAVTRRRYALKFLNGVHADRTDRRTRFLREARAASAAEHPHVVRVHDVFDTDGVLVMVMDFLRGESLGARLRRVRQLTVGEAASILVPVVSAVGAAHARGVIHRDLKPDNVFLAGLEGASEVKVLDFGLAKLFGENSASTVPLTGAGTLLGTPYYMSPEQGLGQRDVDHRTDVWSLGVMLYEMLCGARPVEGENLAQILRRLADDGITPIQAILPDVPSDIAELVGNMLSQDRDDRQSDLHEVLAVLERYTSVRAPAFGAPLSQEPNTVVELPPTSHDGTMEIVPETRSRAFVVAMAGACVILAAALGVIRLSGALRREAAPGPVVTAAPSAALVAEVVSEQSSGSPAVVASPTPVVEPSLAPRRPAEEQRHTAPRVAAALPEAPAPRKPPANHGPHAAEDGFVDVPPF